MRRLDSISDKMRGIVTYEFDDGRRIAFDERQLRAYGLAEMLKHAGIEQPTERVDVFQGGRKVGTVPSYFDHNVTKSRSFFYEPRPNDFTRTERGWEAANQLGPGDLEAIPEFVWDDAERETGRPTRRAEDDALLREALASAGRNPEGHDRATGHGRNDEHAVPSETSADAIPSPPLNHPIKE